MAGTKSIICVKEEDGTHTGITCDYDGYPTYVGAMLVDFYDKPAKVNALLTLGDLSELERNVSPDARQKHDFKTRQSQTCVFYGRDKGDYTRGSRKMTEESFAGIDTYVYKDREWHYVKDGKECTVEKYLSDYYKGLGFPRPKGFYGYLRDIDINIYKAQFEEKERLRNLDLQKQKAKEIAAFGF